MKDKKPASLSMVQDGTVFALGLRPKHSVIQIILQSAFSKNAYDFDFWNDFNHIGLAGIL